jgi:hypothetical protein
VLRAFVAGGLLLLLVPLFTVFGGCGISITVDLDEGGAGSGGAVSLDAAGCWSQGKYCEVNGEQVCVSTSDTHYGCGTGCDPCLVPHATPKCGEVNCEIDSCNPGFDDCDVASLDHHKTGCETNISADQTHCGSCAVNCFNDTSATDWACDNGKCKSINCTDPNTTECNFDDGITCETNKTTIDNCGFCTNVCAAPNATNTCVPDSSPQGWGCSFSCNQGYSDCDGLAPNGCEINLTNDTTNCGGCGVNCDQQLGTAHGTTQCVNGACVIVCDPAWGNCNGSNDGCETPIVTTTNCGACGVPCNPANATGATCASLVCDYGSCNQGYGDCNNVASDGCEQQTNTNQHCGGCNVPCQAPVGGTANCGSGSCVKDCTGPQFDNCDGNPNNCEPLNTSSNCGACGTPCTAPANGTADCSGYTCVQDCNPPSYDNCDGNPNTCEPLNANPNCGGCGITCNAPKTCQGGSCKCPGSQSDCSGTCVNVLGNDDNNCGGCGVNCTGVATCSSGTCVCATGTYCQGAGCCTGGKTCQAGACVCPGGTLDCGTGTCYPGGTCCNDSQCPGQKCCEGSGEDHQCHNFSYNC